MLRKFSEIELAEYCSRGDNVARKQLYEQYADLLMAICIRYCSDRDLAQDVLHDGFLKIFRSFDKFHYKGEGSLRAWLTRIMINEALEALRKRSSLNEQPIDELADEFLSAIPKHTLIAVGTHGFIKETYKKAEWYCFLEKIISTLEPSGIIVYGKLSGNIFKDFEEKCKFYYYEPWIYSNRKKKGGDSDGN